MVDAPGPARRDVMVVVRHDEVVAQVQGRMDDMRDRRGHAFISVRIRPLTT
ncbi:hypothetical protein WME89_32995 [Sorangium sp. So ce321]|uniref:hypothetical protein n=1 Tax=Sorangium sp. So ce321 TaxID=3133300 RepID=UPI003F614955